MTPPSPVASPVSPSPDTLRAGRDLTGRERVVVYGTAWCGYCRRAEELLRRRGVPFAGVDVTDDDEARAALVERAGGRRTVPVVFIDGQAIGGYQELARLAAAGGLDGLATSPLSSSGAPMDKSPL